MNFTLLIISKLCSEVIHEVPVTFGPIEKATLNDLYGKMYDLYPALDPADFHLYWRYSNDLFYHISDYVSFITVLELSAEKAIFVLVDDTGGAYEENETFLRKLDMIVRFVSRKNVS